MQNHSEVKLNKVVLPKANTCLLYTSGSFECSNPMFNRAYQIIDRAIRSNWQAVGTDCPHREKLGWLEQDWLNGEGLVYNYDCRSMIEHTLQNIADAIGSGFKLLESRHSSLA